jgi:hypothetical protein
LRDLRRSHATAVHTARYIHDPELSFNFERSLL